MTTLSPRNSLPLSSPVSSGQSSSTPVPTGPARRSSVAISAPATQESTSPERDHALREEGLAKRQSEIGNLVTAHERLLSNEPPSPTRLQELKTLLTQVKAQQVLDPTQWGKSP